LSASSNLGKLVFTQRAKKEKLYREKREYTLAREYRSGNWERAEKLKKMGHLKQCTNSLPLKGRLRKADQLKKGRREQQ